LGAPLAYIAASEGSRLIVSSRIGFSATFIDSPPQGSLHALEQEL
jgi:hypothetical protein